MQTKAFFLVLLMLSALTIATVSIASNALLPLPANQMETALVVADFPHVEPQGDPVGGGGGGPGITP